MAAVTQPNIRYPKLFLGQIFFQHLDNSRKLKGGWFALSCYTHALAVQADLFSSGYLKRMFTNYVCGLCM